MPPIPRRSPRLPAAVTACERVVVRVPQGRTWWPCLLKGEPEIDTSKCEEGEATNLMSSSGQRLHIQKIELPEVKGEKKYDPVKAEKAWNDFFTKFPDMGAWEITFKGDGEKSMEEQLVDTIEKSLSRDKAEWEKPTAGDDAW
mgnify:CR=1 FL=1